MGKVFTLLILFTTIVSCMHQQYNARHPNVVLILTDDQGWGDLSISGNTNLETPNIDRMAEAGVTFDRFFVCPVCSPTRAELLTGRYHPRSGVFSTSAGGERINLDETTIAGIFKNAGYSTAAYGKWHNGMQPPYHPNARGFDDFYGFCSGHWGNYFSPMLEHNGEIVKGEGFIIDDLTNHGLDFIEKNKGNPFFLYLPFNTPHCPMQVPDEYWDRIKDKELEMRNRSPESENMQHTKAALAMCENIDWNVGRIIQKLDELNLSENTIVIYFSDNGPDSWRWNGGMKGRKGSTDEGGVRVPMFVKWKGALQPGKKIMEIASVIDLLPTLIDLAGIEFVPQKPLDGISLKPLLTKEDPEWEGRLIFNYWTGIGSVKSQESKVIDWTGKTSVRSQRFRLGHAGELFDMENDPGQKKDVSADFPEVMKDLSVAKKQWETELLSGLPKTDPRPFVIGHPDYAFTQIPARDGMAHGNICRSSPYPNDSYFTNWKSTSDSISWDIEVLADGNFEVTLYYTCPAEDVGSTVELAFGKNRIESEIVEAHDPPLEGMEHDLVPRKVSYVKDFKPMSMGAIHLEKGKGILTLKATRVPGAQVMDFRLLMLKRI